MSPLHAWDSWFLLLVVLVSAGAAGCAWAGRRRAPRWWGGAGLLVGLVVAGLALGAGWGRTLCLDAGALVGVALVRLEGTPGATKAAGVYLRLLVVSVLAGAAALALLGAGRPDAPWDRAAIGLLAVAFGLKLALVPLYAWLPMVAEHAAPLTTLLIVSVVDVAAFLELVHLRLAQPWVFRDAQAIWLALALLSMLGGALLALAEQDLKRMLAFSSIDDMGYLLLGLLTGPGPGLAGALLGAASHAASKLLLFAAVAAAETPGAAITLRCRGLAARHPLAGAAFVAGALGMLGIPPTLGFAARWRLYAAGAAFGGPAVLAVMLLATALAVLYYVRAIHRVWLGGGEAPAAVETGRARGVLAALIVAVLLLAVAPIALP